MVFLSASKDEGGLLEVIIQCAIEKLTVHMCSATSCTQIASARERVTGPHPGPSEPLPAKAGGETGS